MKYIVNKNTKKHRIYCESLADKQLLGVMPDVWHLVEADSEGWIPWNGGECPVPATTECYVRFEDGHTKADRCPEGWAWGHAIDEIAIIAYRPILAEKEENEPNKRAFVGLVGGGAIGSQSVFERLKSAIAVSESIPAILSEINAMLPDGYCVTKREAEPAEDMSDWWNWKEGDLVECVDDGESGGDLKEGGYYTFLKERGGDAVIKESHSSWMLSRFRFHSRPKNNSQNY